MATGITGPVTYVRYVHNGETYVSVEGQRSRDLDYTWKVKIDKKSGKRFYVNMGRYGRRWVLPDAYPPAEAAERGGGAAWGDTRGTRQATASPTREGSRTTRQSEDSGGGGGRAGQHLPGDTLSLLDVYKRRVPFNPSDPTLTDIDEAQIAAALSETSKVCQDFNASPEGVFSIVLSALYYIRFNPQADLLTVVHKLSYAVGSDQRSDTLASPFLESQTKIEYLQSINDSIKKSVAEHTRDLDVIRQNLAIREQERKRAAQKLVDWRCRCSDCDKDVSTAVAEGFHVATAVEAHLENLRVVAKVMKDTFPSDACACLAHVERLKAELHEHCNACRELQASYEDIRHARDDLQDSLLSVTRDDASNAAAAAAAAAPQITELQAEVRALRDANAALRAENEDLRQASLPGTPLRGEAEAAIVNTEAVRSLQQQLEAANEEIRTLKAAAAVGQVASPSEFWKGPRARREAAAAGTPSGADTQKRSLLNVIEQQRGLVDTLVEIKDDPDSQLVNKAIGDCLQAAQTKIRSQKQQIKDLKTLLSFCLDLRDTTDDPVRALINATVSATDEAESPSIHAILHKTRRGGSASPPASPP